MVNKFITFEGIEGSGKSTQIKLAAAYLSEKDIPFIVTQEPTGTDIGIQIADILFKREHGHLCAEAELLLFCAARAQHIREVIRPALQQGKIVLCDRFSDATYAYQGAGRGLDREAIRFINDYSARNTLPDMTLLFDLPVETGLKRAMARNNQLDNPAASDRFEREHMEFHTRIREGYLEISRNDPARFRLINADRDVTAIQEDVRRHISDFIQCQK
ncbi:MAG: dTMP kinase [Smithella sp.]|nr:dTMP kinase [Smithella sp.]